MWCFVSLFVVVSTSAIDCLERLVSEVTCYVSSATLNPTHSLTVADVVIRLLLLEILCSSNSLITSPLLVLNHLGLESHTVETSLFQRLQCITCIY